MKNIYLTPFAQKDYKSLKKKNPTVHHRIIAKLQVLRENTQLGKPLVGSFKGVWSLRVGTYRILYEVIQDEIHIYSIKHRKDAYR